MIDTVNESPNMGYGPLYASLVDAREIYSSYLERMMLGEITPEECISKSAEEIDILRNTMILTSSTRMRAGSGLCPEAGLIWEEGVCL